MTWWNIFYVGVGIYIGSYIKQTKDTLYRLYETFQGQDCSNTVLPKRLEYYIPKKIINTLEMGKFLFEYGWVQLEQYLRKSCVQKGRLFHVKFIIENRMYTLIIKPERGPQSEYIMQDENGVDRSEIVKSYLRGSESIYKGLTPRLLGFDKLVKYIENEKISVYDPTDLLKS